MFKGQRTSRLPGGGGLEKPDIYCLIFRKSIVKPRETEEGGLKIPNFTGRLL